MCRFFIYIGRNTQIYPVLFEFEHNLLKQCLKKVYSPLLINNPRDHTINIDGFGIGIYGMDAALPLIYRIVNRVWEDENLKNICKYLKSEVFVGHIRGIKHFQPTISISINNCHPFTYNEYLFCHNGDISKFYKIETQSLLAPYLFKKIQGETDSEFLFYLFLQQIPDLNKKYTGIEMYNFLLKAITQIIKLTDNKPSSFNICVTNKYSTVITRFINNTEDEPPSLYYKKTEKDIIVSSEPLTYSNNWILIPKNHFIIIEKGVSFNLSDIILEGGV